MIYISIILIACSLDGSLPEPVLVDAQVSGHNFPPGISHSIYKEAPSGTQCSNKKVSFTCHQEIDKWIICASLPAETRFISCHCHVSDLAGHVRVVKVPVTVTSGFVNDFLKIVNG